MYLLLAAAARRCRATGAAKDVGQEHEVKTIKEKRETYMQKNKINSAAIDLTVASY